VGTEFGCQLVAAPRRDIYRRIVAGVMTFSERGLPIHDLAISSRTRRARFAPPDPRSREHLRRKPGNRIVAARIGALLAETWGLQPKP
jgi:hypothetical protein